MGVRTVASIFGSDCEAVATSDGTDTNTIDNIQSIWYQSTQ